MEALVGPPLGPLTPLAPLRGLTSGEFVPVDLQVAGDKLFVLEQRIDPREARLTVRDAGGASAPVTSLTLTREDRPVIAGELVAVARRPSIPATGRRGEVTIQGWRTGAAARIVSVPIEVASMDLRPDGRIVVSDVRGTIGELGLDGAFRRITRSGRSPAYAGRDIVYVTGDRVQQLMVAGPGRVPRPLGVPSAGIDGFAVDGQRAVWSAHGCLLVTNLRAPATLSLPPGPCPRCGGRPGPAGELDAPAIRRASRRAGALYRCAGGGLPRTRAADRQSRDGQAGIEDASGFRAVADRAGRPPSDHRATLRPRCRGRARQVHPA